MAKPPRYDHTLYMGGGMERIKRIFPTDVNATIERPLFDSVAQEPARLAGLSFRFYSLRRAKNRHPLYGEPVVDGKDWAFAGPWEANGVIEFDQENDINPSATSEGLTTETEITFWVARKELEDVSAPDPKIGDVIEFWDAKPFGRAEFQYWDVVKANPSGNIQSTSVFVQWKITLKNKGEFNPSRKIENEKI